VVLGVGAWLLVPTSLAQQKGCSAGCREACSAGTELRAELRAAGRSGVCASSYSVLSKAGILCTVKGRFDLSCPIAVAFWAPQPMK
jgi:hypothetical protein